jgi:nucleotide-binding universal stress UspA family protein
MVCAAQDHSDHGLKRLGRPRAGSGSPPQGGEIPAPISNAQAARLLTAGRELRLFDGILEWPRDLLGMTMQLVRVLLPIDQRGTTEACVAAAFALARRFRTEVEVLHPCSHAGHLLPYSSSGLSPFSSDPDAFVMQELIEGEREQTSLAKRRAKAWWKKTAKTFPMVPATFASREGLVSTLVAMHARLADFSIVPTVSEPEDTFWTDVREGALLSSGRPMLVVPPEVTHHRADTVVIAWKDRPEAVRAIVAAAPFLAKAKLVRVVSVAETDQDESSLTEVTAYLSRAGVAAQATLVPRSSREVGEVLIAEAGKYKAAMLVMGAFGHSRLREWAFGGATNYMLRNATVPVMMMH